MSNNITKEERPTIVIDVRASESYCGKTVISAIIIRALMKYGFTGKVNCQDGDINKFLADNKYPVKVAVRNIKRMNIDILVNDLNEPITKSESHFKDSKAIGGGTMILTSKKT